MLMLWLHLMHVDREFAIHWMGESHVLLPFPRSQQGNQK